MYHYVLVIKSIQLLPRVLLLPPSLCLKPVDERQTKETSIKAGNHVCRQLYYISQVPKSKGSAEEEGFWRCKTEIPQKQAHIHKSGKLFEKKLLELLKKREKEKRVCVCVCICACFSNWSVPKQWRSPSLISVFLSWFIKDQGQYKITFLVFIVYG